MPPGKGKLASQAPFGYPAPYGREGALSQSSGERWGWMSLGQMLVNDGILSEAQLTEALSRQRRTRDRLGHVLIEMKLIDEQVLLKYLGAQFRKEAITHQELLSLDLDVVKLVPEEVARQYRIIAAERHGRKLVVATADPLNVVALDDLRRATGLEVDFKIGPGWAIQEAIEKTYRRMISTEGIDEALRQDLGLSVGTVPAIEELVDIQQLRTQAADPPVVKVVNYVLSRAAADGASDIHVEAYEDRTRVRYRIDGLLFDLLEVPRSLHLAVVSRLKIISRLDIAERRLPQDGSFASHINNREIDFRVSTLPTIYGEKVVLRLLEKEAVRIGGGLNHRFGLYDMIMLKDNHIDYCGGIEKAIEKAYEYVQTVKPGLLIEVETRSIEDVMKVMEVGKVNRIMLDNFTPAMIAEALEIINGQYETEASGGITLENIQEYAATGVDYISSGAIIHQARSLDLSVIAEGVETRDQLTFLQAQECGEGQGYYFGRPVAAEQFARVLEAGVAAS